MALEGTNTFRFFCEAGSSSTWFGLPVLLGLQTEAGVSDKTITISPHKFKLLMAWVVLLQTGGVGDTVKLTDGTTDITDTKILTAVADKTQVLFATIDDAVSTLVNKDIHVITASDALIEVNILGVRIA